jgi:hypothetical protein
VKPNRRLAINCTLLLTLLVGLATVPVRLRADTGFCPPVNGLPVTLPFMDVQGNPFFCAIAAAYFSGLTNGTTATTYSPTQAVPREQMAAFVSRTLDQSLRRGSRRAALGQWWISRPAAHHMTNVGDAPQFLVSDGHYIYVSNTLSGNITKVEASTGLVAGTITPSGIWAMSNLQGILVAGGYIWVVGHPSSSSFDAILGLTPDGAVVKGGSISGKNPQSLTCDGANIWSANLGTGPNTGSITRLAISNSAGDTFTAGFNQPFSILYDGAWLWVADRGDNTLKRVDPANGTVVGSPIPVGNSPGLMTFDGTNIWVPALAAPQVVVVRAVGPLQGTVLASYSVQFGFTASAYDGERILMTHYTFSQVALWKAADLTSLGILPLPNGSGPTGVCSDGVKFWVTLQAIDKIVSF